MAVKSETNGNKKDRSGATNKGTMATQEGIACTTIGGNHKDATIETNQTLLARVSPRRGHEVFIAALH
jgi:hypothetical protein